MAGSSGTETITLNGEPADNYPQVNLLQVRDITIAATSNPVIASANTSGGKLIFNGTGGTANGTYNVLTSTSLFTPIANWVPIATNLYDSSGNFSITDVLRHNNSDQFYIIKQP